MITDFRIRKSPGVWTVEVRTDDGMTWQETCMANDQALEQAVIICVNNALGAATTTVNIHTPRHQQVAIWRKYNHAITKPSLLRSR